MATVSICGVPFTLNREEDHFRVDHAGNGDSLWGQISYKELSIKYLASCPQQELRTVLHEILHGIIEGSAIRELKDKNNEHMEMPIIQLANGLAEALESMGLTIKCADVKRRGSK